MNQSTDCHCGGSAHGAGCSCGQVALELPRYYPRQLLTPVELTLEQQYFRDRLRRHNRLVHGWGVVCGTAVCAIPGEPDPAPGVKRTQPWKIRVQPGYVLGPYGDEILLDRELTVDLRTVGLSADGCGDPVDPWCSDVFLKREGGPLYVAVRYLEVQTRPVRVQPVGCGCDDTQCENSRLRDGYEIGILTDCPQSHLRPPTFEEVFRGGLPGCPPCPVEPWVVLAKVDLDPDGTIRRIHNCKEGIEDSSCRRMAASFASFWWRCEGDPCAQATHTQDQPATQLPPAQQLKPASGTQVGNASPGVGGIAPPPPAPETAQAAPPPSAPVAAPAALPLPALAAAPAMPPPESAPAAPTTPAPVAAPAPPAPEATPTAPATPPLLAPTPEATPAALPPPAPTAAPATPPPAATPKAVKDEPPPAAKGKKGSK